MKKIIEKIIKDENINKYLKIKKLKKKFLLKIN